MDAASQHTSYHRRLSAEKYDPALLPYNLRFAAATKHQN